MFQSRRTLLSSLATSLVLVTLAGTSSIAAAGNNPYAPVTIYFTRHAEKETEQMAVAGEPGKFMEICGTSKCAEILSDKGLARAELLADWFTQRGITGQLTHAFSSHKNRTRQTITPIAAAAQNLAVDADLIPGDGIQQIPSVNTSELNDGSGSQGTSGTVAPTAAALLALPGGSVAVVAGHSGSIYPIMEAIGLNTMNNPANFPRKASNGKIPEFGDIWKVVLQNGNAQLHWRVNLQPGPLVGTW